MKILQIHSSKPVNYLKPSRLSKSIAIAVPLIATAKDASAHAAPFYHMHDSAGHTIGMGAGILLFAGAVVAAGVAMYKRYNQKSEDIKEKTDNK